MMPSNTNTNPALEEGVETQMNDEQPEKNRNKEKRRGRPGRKRKQTMVDINEASSEMVAAPKCQSSQESSAQVHNGEVESNQQDIGNSQQIGEKSVPENDDRGRSVPQDQNLKDQESNEESTSLDGDIEIDLEMENGCYTPKDGQDSEKGESEKVPSALRKKYKKRQLEAAEKVTHLKESAEA